MAISLAVKYRPKTFEEALGQGSTIKILRQQIEKGCFGNCYLFAGSSGCGKTTLARIFANLINQGKGSPIEIDGASNNGVESVRAIVDSAGERSLDSEYKIYIVDECHAISSQGWQAFLKCIEEPPKYTIFMFCTTNPEKVPETIQNRLIRFNISKVRTDLIKQRLIYICKQEGYCNYEEACDYISKFADGSVRSAITYLEKCVNYSEDLSIENVLNCLGNFSYKKFFDLTNHLIDKEEKEVISLLDEFYNSGNDMKLFIEQYLDFVLDITKYCLFVDINQTKIPSSLIDKLNFTVGDDKNMALKYFNLLLDKVLNIKNAIKYDVNNRTTISVMFINICRGVKE